MYALLLIAFSQAAPPPPNEAAPRPVQLASNTPRGGSFDQAWLNSLTDQQREALTPRKAMATGAAAHTPLAEVTRVVSLLPKPQVAFVDYGCGYDARWCVAAAERWKDVRVVGVEIDPGRAAAARERVRHLGLDNRITIVEGDATTTDVQGDVAVVYLYPEVLVKLKPRLRKFRAVASYLHAVDGLTTQRSGDTWLYTQAAPVQFQTTQASPGVAYWGGVPYSAPVCNSPNCSMCNYIRQNTGF